MANYLPSKDADLLTWSQGYSGHITATPVDFGLTADDATELAGLVTAYQTALAAEKNDPRLVAAARDLRDRWLEQLNSGNYLLESNGKYLVDRATQDADVSTPLLPPARVKAA